LTPPAEAFSSVAVDREGHIVLAQEKVYGCEAGGGPLNEEVACERGGLGNLPI